MEWLVCDWQEEDEIHLVPDDGKEHVVTGCWCSPEVSRVGDKFIILHNLIQ
jgi:hypothetical protein